MDMLPVIVHLKANAFGAISPDCTNPRAGESAEVEVPPNDPPASDSQASKGDPSGPPSSIVQ